MKKIIILYSTTDGHTLKISQYIKSLMDNKDHHIDVLPIGRAREVQLESYDRIVIGASIRYGKHSAELVKFVLQNTPLLIKKQSAFFSVNLIARKKEKTRVENNAYVRKFLKQTHWQPATLAIFAGKLDYPRYGFWDKLMIRLIMKLTKGPTDPATVIEYTDWQAVEAFAKKIGEIDRDRKPA